MCITNRHDMTLAVKVVLNPNTTNQIALADYKIKLDKMRIFVFDRVECTVQKGENAGYQHFLLFP